MKKEFWQKCQNSAPIQPMRRVLNVENNWKKKVTNHTHHTQNNEWKMISSWLRRRRKKKDTDTVSTVCQNGFSRANGKEEKRIKWKQNTNTIGWSLSQLANTFRIILSWVLLNTFCMFSLLVTQYRQLCCVVLYWKGRKTTKCYSVCAIVYYIVSNFEYSTCRVCFNDFNSFLLSLRPLFFPLSLSFLFSFLFLLIFFFYVCGSRPVFPYQIFPHYMLAIRSRSKSYYNMRLR